ELLVPADPCGARGRYSGAGSAEYFAAGRKRYGPMDCGPSGWNGSSLRGPIGGRSEGRRLTGNQPSGDTSLKECQPMKSEVRELLTEELKDAYSAEKQALRCMQRALRKASADALRQGIQMHIDQTQVQIESVEQALETMSVRP